MFFDASLIILLILVHQIILRSFEFEFESIYALLLYH